jgi:phage host-nuclease inhibitor protein Gam
MSMVKTVRIKTAAANQSVPQNRDEAARDLALIGDQRRRLTLLEAEMNDELAKIKLAYEIRANPERAELKSLVDGLRIWAEANRVALTGGDKTKTVDLGTGLIRWRSLPPSVSHRGKKMEVILAAIRARAPLARLFLRTKVELNKEAILEKYAEAQREAFRLAGPSFMRHFDLKQESAEVRASFGGEFGQRCLLARRLIQGGVRFVEVSHNLNFINGAGWDVHNEGINNQHVLIRELDNALAGLIEDLKRTGLLDKTLVVIGTEFGRPPEFDGKGGRGHQGTAFSMVFAGGGLNHCGAFGVTDDLAKKVLENPVSIPDFHATILAALQVDTTRDLMAGSRPVPVTDAGRPIEALF